MPDKFTIGERYYSFEHDEAGPKIHTWTYCGFQEVDDCSSTSCDVPYHFHVFELTEGLEGTKNRIRIPSLEVAKRLKLTWTELCDSVAVADEIDRRLADADAHPEQATPWEDVKAQLWKDRS